MTPNDPSLLDDDSRTLRQWGYAQELSRRMSPFSNFALSLSIICILAGGITSFHLGFCSVGGAAIGLGWPLACLFSSIVALTMGQVASAFPTAGGLYHWAAILGGRGWGWATAWFNLLGLITVLAAINVGTYQFCVGAFFPDAPRDTAEAYLLQLGGVALITLSQAFFNHLGVRVVSRLTDFSGYWILLLSAALTLALLAVVRNFDPARLFTFSNFSGAASGENPVWPAIDSLPWLFALGLLLPAYTITGFDASAHASEETVGAAHSVPRGIVRSVVVSGVAGWVMLIAIVLAMPSVDDAARQGEGAIFWTLRETLSPTVVTLLCAGIAIAQYLCGLATVTSASRMMYAFARDGGTPASAVLRRIHPHYRTPVPALWTVAVVAILFTAYTPVYSTITAVCTIFLYISYVLPTALGFVAFGRSWRTMGPWHLGPWYRPLALVSVIGCVGLIAIGMHPPNDKAAWVTGAMALLLVVAWFAGVKRRFAGPPVLQPVLQEAHHG